MGGTSVAPGWDISSSWVGYRGRNKWLGGWISVALGGIYLYCSCPCVNISGVSAALGMVLEAPGWDISSPWVGY
jgi:hypothetical protein